MKQVRDQAAGGSDIFRVSECERGNGRPRRASRRTRSREAETFERTEHPETSVQNIEGSYFADCLKLCGSQNVRSSGDA